MVITDPQDGLKAWLCTRIKYVPTPLMTCIGLTDPRADRLLAVVGYDHWSPTSVEMHVAAEEGSRWITRQHLWSCFHYPFIRGGVEVAIARVASDNQAALKLDMHLGFKEIGRIPNAAPAADLVILAMQRSECKWLNLGEKFDGREIST